MWQNSSERIPLALRCSVEGQVEQAHFLSHVVHSETPWTVAHQALLFMGFFQARVEGRVAISSSKGPSGECYEAGKKIFCVAIFSLCASGFLLLLHCFEVFPEVFSLVFICFCFLFGSAGS